ncbi:hypothetical protein [Flavobacterium pectinovorum]|uniref:SMODS-associating 2TM beta-strand rich effector domain-containing protein n=1 Tax=Flavobacterium pectinovorum TaxID=29533 RepID=A0AB36P1K3_9FLAO|nr:hypothetical protein [Flavobacterium pectinovorum]OXB04954.1 hypothetical protein B0A72_10780 [Flavobacterium pectinovorum]SHL33842.1 hypothetical protein SAMN05444387_0357 [Flavobacterium pectinovorum]
MNILLATEIVLEKSFGDTFWYDLLIALFTGVLSCLIFYLALRIFKPNIKTCSILCKEIETFDDKTKTRYYFKFINKTYSDIENVSINLLLIEDYIHGSGKNFIGKELKLKRYDFKNIPGKRRKNKEIHNNCVQMLIDEDLEKLWDGRKEYLELQIDCTHSKSGRRLVHVQKYTDVKNTIKNGRFDSGENFNII